LEVTLRADCGDVLVER